MNRKNIIIILIALVAIVAIGYFSSSNIGGGHMTEEHHDDDDIVESYEIYPGDVADKIKNNEDIILLDVRTHEEYEEMHLENALLLPVQELSAKSLAEIGLGENAKDKEIIIYCRSGSRSKTAYEIMSSLGYTNIKSSAGGMIHWQEDNYPFTEMGAYMGSHMVNNSSTETSTNGPRISLSQTFHDFGVIPQFGGTVEKEFTMTNSGTETLVIGDISTSCSCTSAETSKTEIEAGGEAIITVVFDPDFHEEPFDVFKRTVFIPTNDPTNSEAEITVQVDIEEGK